MKMNRFLQLVAMIGGAWIITSCKPAYQLTEVSGGRVAMDSSWDAHPNRQAQELLMPYKAKIDSVMYRVIGQAQCSMQGGRPESLLSNLIADVLRQSATQVLGKAADMGLVNMGGLRSVLTQGPITVATAYEILPFDNSLCVLTLKGSVLKQLFQNIADRGGEGVSGVQLVMDSKGKVLSAMVAGKPVNDEQRYTVATIDYLAEGNDGMTALMQAEDRVCPQGAILRSLFMDYVEQQTAAGKALTAKIEGRIQVK